MKIKKIPMRTCIVTKEKLPKKDLLRIVKTPFGVIADLTGKVNGHGIYIKKDLTVLLKAINNKLIEKSLECSVSDSEYSQIKEVLNNELK